ncbi:hypothetical protein D3C71_2217550 [compost metagenome]
MDACGVMMASPTSDARITTGLSHTNRLAAAPLRVALGMAASVQPAAMAAVM